MRRAVVDPGVFVSALLTPHGTASKLVDALLLGQWQLVASPLLFEELTDVLLRKRFHRYFDAAQVYEFVAQLITVAVLVEDPIARPKVTGDPDDDYLVALAAAAQAAALVSGDHHLTDLGRVGDVRIVTPREFLNELASSET
ncbi:MAG: putative toxin-antitoxin system toxin component, PIN family [Egibacteraceae bacterium]